jgi:hypothetical protein
VPGFFLNPSRRSISYEKKVRLPNFSCDARIVDSRHCSLDNVLSGGRHPATAQRRERTRDRFDRRFAIVGCPYARGRKKVRLPNFSCILPLLAVLLCACPPRTHLSATGDALSSLRNHPFGNSRLQQPLGPSVYEKVRLPNFSLRPVL